MNPPKVLIFGAGKTGRGFAGAICARSGLSFALVDQDQRLVEELRETNSYPIQLLGEESEWGTFAFENAWSIAEPAWEEALMEASVCFTAVFGNNLKALGERLAEPLRRRLDYNPEAYLNIITLENQDHAATLLKAAVMAQIHDDEIQHALLQKIGFVEGIVLKTCLGPDTSRAQTMRVTAPACAATLNAVTTGWAGSSDHSSSRPSSRPCASQRSSPEKASTRVR